jgi:hypothetical protein
MSMSGGASDNVVSVIEDAVHKVWPEYKFPLTKEQDATLTHEQSVAVSDELCNLRATIDDFPLVCDEAVLHGEYIAFGAWLRAQTTGSGCVVKCMRCATCTGMF